ncbi:MAG: hypothetical protein CMJ29_08665 [Phycisphaerae bacterium]|nr:hypothetical protein [Phycisphaerae bacterium]
MSPGILLRASVLLVVISWSFLDYCFIRSSFGVVQPGIGSLFVILMLTLLLMIPMIAVTALWAMPDIWACRLAADRMKRGECGHCGHTMKGTRGDICLECGGHRTPVAFSINSLILPCVIVLMGSWLIGAVGGEIMVRIDESHFMHIHGGSPTQVEVQREWPLWGSLQWDPMTSTARSTLD